MIQFFVNNIEIVLPEDFTTTIIEENELITRNGEYSLDIDSSLLESANARAFNHIYRLNNSTVDKDGECRMILDGKTRNGKYVVISNSDIAVKWQFVAGNSEVNYIGGDRKIWELDFGELASLSFAQALTSVLEPTWTRGYCCIPAKFSNMTANDYKFPTIALDNSVSPALWKIYRSDGTYGGLISLGDYILFDAVENVTMHVYLLHIINKLPGILGYTIVENVLINDERAKLEILINRTNSLKYSSALPNMTVVEFISAIEYAYNVVFDFNSTTKEMSIIRTTAFIENMEANSQIVLDDYTREPSSDAYRFDFTSISYNIASLGFSKYQKIASDVADICVNSEYANLNALKSSISDADKNKFILHETIDDNEQYVYTDAPTVNVYRKTVNGKTGQLLAVNKLRDYFVSQEKELIISKVPVAMCQSSKSYSITGQSGTYEVSNIFQLPIIDSQLYLVSEQSVLSAIDTSVNSIKRSSNIEVCLYNGIMFMPVTSAENRAYFFPIYPIPFVDYKPEFWVDGSANSASIGHFENWLSNRFAPKATQTLSIVKPGGIKDDYYPEETLIETSDIYIFKLVEHHTLTVKSLLIYANKKYIPIKFEREISNKKNELVTGYFYRMK